MNFTEIDLTEVEEEIKYARKVLRDMLDYKIPARDSDIDKQEGYLIGLEHMADLFKQAHDKFYREELDRSTAHSSNMLSGMIGLAIFASEGGLKIK